MAQTKTTEYNTLSRHGMPA